MYVFDPGLSDNEIKYMDRKISGGRTHWQYGHHNDIGDEKAHTITTNCIQEQGTRNEKYKL